jgi:23S rRNA (uridine2552-2'-O)-methyltransferase
MRDKFTVKAKAEGYKARSVFKLKNINNKFKLIKPEDKVLDLGAWPGSWSQYCLDLKAEVDAVDLKEVKIEGVNFIEADVFDEDLFEKLDKYDVVISDLAPKTIGVRKVDNELSFDISLRALEIAKKVLNKNGNFVCKIFNSELFGGFIEEVKDSFRVIKILKPEASKKRSKEVYVVGIRKF